MSARLVDHLDSRANGLNLLRLLLASQVVFWHTYAVQGVDFGSSALRPIISSAGVDGFFAISGFLILMSWHRRPHSREFITARALRILPAFYVVLLATVFLFAPLCAVLQGESALMLLSRPQSYTYFWQNLLLWIVEPSVAGTPLDVPYAGSWNASLWTLAWEFACYLGVLVLGITHLASRRWVILAIFLLFTVASATAVGLHVTSHNVQGGIRLGLMFSAGMLVYSFRDIIRVKVWYAGLAAALMAISVTLPDYRIVAALPFAYLLLVIGGAMRHRYFWFRTDVSYGVYVYAFPIQQLLVVGGLGSLAVWRFALLALVCTLPLAWLSWTLVEGPSLRLKHRMGSGLSSVGVLGDLSKGV